MEAILKLIRLFKRAAKTQDFGVAIEGVGDAVKLYNGAKGFTALGPDGIEVVRAYGALFAQIGAAASSSTSGISPFTPAEKANMQAARRDADAKFRILLANVPTTHPGD